MKKTYIIICGILISLLLVGTVMAAGDYQINWWTVDNGGGTSQSADGHYAISGTIGQSEASSASGGSYTLNGGFWHGINQEFLIHLPVVTR